MESTDEDLRLLLDRLPRISAPAVPAGSFGFALGFDPARAVISQHPDLVKEIIASLNTHAEFSGQRSLFFDTAQLHFQPYSGAVSLVVYAVRHGSQPAIDWYRRVIHTRATTIRHASLVSGLTSEERVDFSNGISLLPPEKAGDAPQIMFAQQPPVPNPLLNVFGTHSNAVAFKDVEYERTDTLPTPTDQLKVIAAVEDILVGSILNEGLAPALIASWDEFLDPDLRAAKDNLGTVGAPQDAPASFGRALKEEDIQKINWFLSERKKFDGKFKAKLDMALTRVGLARRKTTTANKAIEYCIALESLLSEGNTEMTHKIATRSAIILSKNYEQRVEDRDIIKNLYKIRSKAVHGGKVDQENQVEIVNKSDKKISELLLIAAERGEASDFVRIDLNFEP